MKKQLQTWKFLLESIEKKIPCMLLYVLESKGSSPGRQGFFMGVNETGVMEGSIGGGIMEYKFVEMAKDHLRQLKRGPGDLYRQVHDKSSGEKQSGMICSGEQTIFAYPLKTSDMETLRMIINSLEAQKNGTLIITPGNIRFINAVPAEDFSFIKTTEEDWVYTEKTGFKNKLFIIGGGHCSLALSKLMNDLGFYITVFEERAGLNTVQRNTFAHEVIQVDDYSALKNMVPSGKDQYIVIMTVGYRTDDIAIRALAGKSFKYFGVLGSKNKIAKMFADYAEQGFPAQTINQLHAPVGMDISSQTPEEIAVSIAAEIIRVKNTDEANLI